MVVNEHTIITTELLFVKTRPRQKLENQLEMRHESISIPNATIHLSTQFPS